MKNARNVAIILALAVVVAFLPSGQTAAAFVNAVLFTVFTIILVVFAAKFYVERRVEIFSLGDRDRGLAYASLGAIVVALAGRPQWKATNLGVAVVVALLAFAGITLFTVFQRWRSYE